MPMIEDKRTQAVIYSFKKQKTQKYASSRGYDGRWFRAPIDELSDEAFAIKTY